MLHTLQNSNGFPVQAHYHRKPYMVGFRSVMLARKVHYSMSGCESPILMPGVTPIESPATPGLIIDMEATLFVPKNKIKYHQAIEDYGIHLKSMTEYEFMGIPLRTMTGILIATSVLDENDEELVMRALTVDALPE